MHRILPGYLITLAFVTDLVCLQPAVGEEKVKKVHVSPKADKALDELLENRTKAQDNPGRHDGRMRFIRLKYLGGDWDRSVGERNMLIEYGIRTSHKVADKSESLTITALMSFPLGKSPPVVYLTGQKKIGLTNAEIEILREFLVEKHGMLFGDNGGSRYFHCQFVAMMAKILPKVRPVQIPLDDAMHRIPYPLSFMPYVAPHGGKHALGWKVDGRWVCYYHPGNLGAAWADDHAGVNPEVWEASYQLGTNIFFYAHSEYARWLGRGNKPSDPKELKKKLEKELDMLLDYIDKNY